MALEDKSVSNAGVKQGSSPTSALRDPFDEIAFRLMKRGLEKIDRGDYSDLKPIGPSDSYLCNQLPLGR
jgi:hypothetical protein